jgi:hypothetical protein
MFKRIIFLLIGCVCFTGLIAQDVILLTNGNEIKAKVEEVQTDVVTYRKFENITGPLYTIQKNQIFMITYQNGSKDVFTVQQSNPKQVQGASRETNVVSSTDSVVIAKAPLTSHKGIVKQNNKVLTKSEVQQTMAQNPEALSLYKSGSKLVNAEKVMANVSLAVVGGTALLQLGGLLGAPAVYTVAGLFVCTFTTAMIIRSNGRKKINKSVALYNSKL